MAIMIMKNIAKKKCPRPNSPCNEISCGANISPGFCNVDPEEVSKIEKVENEFEDIFFLTAVDVNKIAKDHQRHRDEATLKATQEAILNAAQKGLESCIVIEQYFSDKVISTLKAQGFTVSADSRDRSCAGIGWILHD